TFFQPERADDGHSRKEVCMPSRVLPARPHLDHLKREAKALHKLLTADDTAALQRARDAIGDLPSGFKLTDAQRIVAREYGFPTWALLRDHVAAAREPGEIDRLL